MDIDLSPDPATLSRAFAAWVAGRIRHHVEAEGTCAVAFSGGSTPVPMFAALAGLDVPWHAVHVFQVDERVAPDGHADRNATALRRELLDRVPLPDGRVHLVPVGRLDAVDAAAQVDLTLHEVCGGRLHVVHLGLGDDGHTASWPPGDPVVSSDALVAAVGPFHGRMRVTLTPRCVNRAADVAFLVSGAGKQRVVGRLIDHDPSMPASVVRDDGVVVFVDRSAFA